MKKIMFNDRYGLTSAVIEGRKTMTRRIEPICKLVDGWVELGYTRIEVVKDGKVRFYNNKGEYVEEKTRYSIDEVVAVAQSYEQIYHKEGLETMDMLLSTMKYSPGWGNKMYTRSDLMPHQIRITDIRIKRLRDISDEDCLKEGIEKFDVFGEPASYISPERKKFNIHPKWWVTSPREAFAALIDGVSGHWTWNSNPYVVVYQFELIK